MLELLRNASKHPSRSNAELHSSSDDSGYNLIAFYEINDKFEHIPDFKIWPWESLAEDGDKLVAPSLNQA